MTKNSLQALYCTTATAFEHSAHTLTNRASPTATGILAPTSFYSSIDLRRSRLHVGLATIDKYGVTRSVLGCASNKKATNR